MRKQSNAMMQLLSHRAVKALGAGRQALHKMQNILLPPQCPITGEIVSAHGQLAPAAWQKLEFIAPPFCDLCGMPFEVAATDGLLCATCTAPDEYSDALISADTLDRVRAALHYDDVSARLVLGLKYADRHDTVAGLATLMMQAEQDFLAAGDRTLIPVPLHPSRLRQRRFNQAGLLAREIADRTESNLCLNLLERRRATPQQQGLSAKARQRNVKGAFRLNTRYQDLVTGQCVLLIDDVLTTGSTLVECARVLKRAGAAEVNALVLARVVKAGIIAI